MNDWPRRVLTGMAIGLMLFVLMNCPPKMIWVACAAFAVVCALLAIAWIIP